MPLRHFSFIVIVCILTLAGFSHGTPGSLGAGLCAADERVVFSCPTRRSNKTLSLCASRTLAKDRGYLQYRFGVPGKLELEFPKDREGSLRLFHYNHYFRARFDQSSVTFANEGTQYSVFNDYNGEEKPERIDQGVTVTPAGGGKDVTLLCAGRAKVDFANLETVLPEPAN